ncbi:5'-nucleotidase domain-containing protein 1-like [Sinocyclocheilus rhinocerous]|uniref:5'-nucleotidase domain-containing protein 1-like n=1 Tax=Sinocyclocheilus rhinocerous TaxID=307959 RepID=UPI0007B79599|nr:PREDICTED: 5'-nucleotidase domain-containing protein 1-like [Sinocyclocheilus rhinocerous]
MRVEDTGTYFPSVKRCPGRYLQPCSDAVKRWLRSMKKSGKILLLITSSHSDYCRLVCEHILGSDFEELFDIIITNALKPGFFSLVPQQRPFRTLVDDVEDSEGLPSLEKPGWYSQGNWPHLHELLKTMTNKTEPKDQGMKSPSAVSNQWGSYFVDVQKNEGEETRSLTWCCHSIHTYSTMAIPSIEAIADLPLDFKFQRFSSDKPITTGYYPRPPDSLLKWEEN